VVEVDEGPVRPELLMYLLPRHDLAWSFQQQQQNLKGLAGEMQPSSLLP
jgi:hypothetical protein